MKFGTMKPGALKPGALKPGALKSGALKSGALKSGALRPGAMKSGAMKFGAAALLCLLLPGCATDSPVKAFDSSAGLTACQILGDGFVLTGDRRIPLEAFVLELRQVTRGMTRDELSRYVVTIGFNPDVQEGPAAKNISDGREYLLRQLQIMGVRQAGT